MAVRPRGLVRVITLALALALALTLTRFDHVAANASFRGGRGAFDAYVNVPLQRAKYDFVSVDGRVRPGDIGRYREI